MNKTPARLRAKAPLGDAALMGISTRQLKAQPGSLRRGLYRAVTGCAGSLGSYCHRSLRRVHAAGSEPGMRAWFLHGYVALLPISSHQLRIRMHKQKAQR